MNLLPKLTQQTGLFKNMIVVVTESIMKEKEYTVSSFQMWSIQ
jgi:hypothetical protein